MFDRVKSAARAVGRALAIGNDRTGLEAGRRARRMSGWLPGRDHVNTLVTASGRTVLARARFLVRNNPYAASAVECFASNLAGAGIVPSWSLGEGEDELKAKIQKTWIRWTDEADADAVTDFEGLQRRGARELFIAGEFFVRRRPRRLTDGLLVPMQLQMLPSEMLPIEYTMPLGNGNWLRQGIEFDAIGRRVAYHFWKVHPGDSTERPNQGEITIVPANEIAHVYDPIEAGQLRGLPRLTPAIVSLWMLDGYDDAELERKKTAALFSVFIKRNDPGPTFINKVAEDAAKAADGAATVNLVPGAAHQLLPGEDVTVAAPADVGSSYEAFQYRALTRICAALGLPYAGVTGDMVRANYSNLRAAMVQLRRSMESLQHSVMVFQLCRPVSRGFLDAATFAGALELPGYAADPTPYTDITWIPPRWEWVDPLKDRQAEVLAVDALFKSRSSVIRQEGGDPVEVDREIAADQQRANELGIKPIGTVSPAKEIAAQPPEEAPAPAAADRANTLNGHLPGPVLN